MGNTSILENQMSANTKYWVHIESATIKHLQIQKNKSSNLCRSMESWQIKHLHI